MATVAFQYMLWHNVWHLFTHRLGGALDKVRENRARRAVARRGYRLEKRRRRDERAWDYGTYQIVDPFTDTVVLADRTTGQYGLSIDDVEKWLAGDTPKPG